MFCFIISTKFCPINSTFLVTVLRDDCKSFIGDKISDLFIKFSNKTAVPSKKLVLLFHRFELIFYS
jgi:hypothetical protein